MPQLPSTMEEALKTKRKLSRRHVRCNCGGIKICEEVAAGAKMEFEPTDSRDRAKDTRVYVLRGMLVWVHDKDQSTPIIPGAVDTRKRALSPTGGVGVLGPSGVADKNERIMTSILGLKKQWRHIHADNGPKTGPSKNTRHSMRQKDLK